jgi:hypothetical protein
METVGQGSESESKKEESVAKESIALDSGAGGV